MWLLDTKTRNTMAQLAESGIVPTADQEKELQAALGRNSEGQPVIYKKAGKTAQINIDGVLTKKPNWMAYFFAGGNTTYTDIIDAVRIAESDPSVDNIVLSVESPGGQVAGMFEAFDVVRNAKKPGTALVSTLAASAAYGLVSQADKIVATNRAAMFGSVGIAARFSFSKNVESVVITSEKAPEKVPDPRTAEGKAAIERELNALHDLFADAIANGRGITAEQVNENFGKGAVVLAAEAKENGMIDEISTGEEASEDKSNAPAVGASVAEESKTMEAKKMDLKTLKAEHPDVYAQAKSEGVELERDRVKGHLTMGQASGDMETAISAISDGKDMTQELQAKYLSAGMNRQATEARTEDDDDASKAAGSPAGGEGGDAGASDEEKGKNILAKAAAQCGVTLEV